MASDAMSQSGPGNSMEDRVAELEATVNALKKLLDPKDLSKASSKASLADKNDATSTCSDPDETPPWCRNQSEPIHNVTKVDMHP